MIRSAKLGMKSNKIKEYENKVKDVAPFLKWAGGKRQLLSEIEKHLPNHIDRYCEPFLGGGAMLFHIQPHDAIVNDINSELINVYESIRDNVSGIIKELKKYPVDEDFYYSIRNKDRTSKIEKMSKTKRAARIIYLNKTCYNGLFRVNRNGQFNVPFGKYKNPNIVNEKTLRAVSNYLKQNRIKFNNLDFNSLEKKIKRDTFVYVDPPYHPISKTSSFTNYANNGFSEEDQVRLKEFCERLVIDKGCTVVISNSYTKFIRSLYTTPRFKINKIRAKRNINSVGNMRGKIDEALIIGT